MKEYFLKAAEFSDIGTYKEEKQTMVDEGQINHAFDPANDLFDGLREAGDWVFDFFSNLSVQLSGYFSHAF